MDPAARTSGRRRSPLTVAGWGAFAGLYVAGAIFQGDSTQIGMLLSIPFAAVACVLIVRRPENAVGWIIAIIAILFSITRWTYPYPIEPLIAGIAPLRHTLTAWVLSPGSTALFGAFYLLAMVFPSGRFPSGRIGLAARASLAVPLTGILVAAFGPSIKVTFSEKGSDRVTIVQNQWALAPGWGGWDVLSPETVPFASIPLVGVAAGAILWRHRQAGGIERQQLRWFVAAMIAVAGTALSAVIGLQVLPEAGDSLWLPTVVAYPLLPIAVGIAILRHHLYAIDRIVSRTIGWALVTAAVIAVFALGNLVLQSTLADLTGADSVVIAVSTILALAVVQPVRRRLQLLVDHRFDRARIDADRETSAFSERLRNELDLTAIADDLVATTDASLRPAAASVWLARRPAVRG